MAHKQLDLFLMGILALSIAVCCACGAVHLQDGRLIENFNTHEMAFEQLRAMAESDAGFVLISPRRVTAASRSTPRKAGEDERREMNPERYSEYMRRFKELGLDNGIIRDEQSVWFRAEVPSFSNGAVTKGYVYSLGELTPLVADLDGYVPEPTPDSRRPRFLVFKLLKPHWYLYKLSNG
jgi:hypothetical protein